MGAAACQSKDALGRPPHPRCRAEVSYLAGEFDPRNLRGNAGRRRVLAVTLQQVGAVQGGGPYPHQDLLRCNVRLTDLANFQDLRPAEMGNPHRLHGIHEYFRPFDPALIYEWSFLNELRNLFRAPALPGARCTARLLVKYLINCNVTRITPPMAGPRLQLPVLPGSDIFLVIMYEDFHAADRCTGQQLHCVCQSLIVAIATRHADAVDIKFLAGGRPVWIAVPHPTWVEYNRRTGRAITDRL